MKGIDITLFRFGSSFDTVWEGHFLDFARPRSGSSSVFVLGAPPEGHVPSEIWKSVFNDVRPHASTE